MDFLNKGRATIKKSLFTTLPILLLATVIPFIAVYIPALMPAEETTGGWFQRSGSIVVALVVWIELKNNSIDGYIFPNGMVSSEYGIFSKEYKTYFLAIRWFGVTLAILGTIIWGYGDILLKKYNT